MDIASISLSSSAFSSLMYKGRGQLYPLLGPHLPRNSVCMLLSVTLQERTCMVTLNSHGGYWNEPGITWAALPVLACRWMWLILLVIIINIKMTWTYSVPLGIALLMAGVDEMGSSFKLKQETKSQSPEGNLQPARQNLISHSLRQGTPHVSITTVVGFGGSQRNLSKVITASSCDTEEATEVFNFGP